MRRSFLRALLVLPGFFGGIAHAQDTAPAPPPPTDTAATPPAPEPAPAKASPLSGFPFKSTRGPFYVQATLGYNHWASAPGVCGGSGCGGWPGFRPDVEFGMHFTGRHDGLVVAVRQSFVFTAGPGNIGATTVLKLGYDLAIPIKQFEVTAGPYTSAGIGYTFADGATLGFNAGFFGIEGKFFFTKGLYGFLRPFEFGMQCFHTPSTNCWLQAATGVGVGFAFPTVAN